MAGTFIVHIPYRGSGPAVQDVIAGQVDFGIDTLVTTAPHIKSGALRALAVTAGKRVKGFENMMSSYKGTASEDDVRDIIAYMKTLK